MPSKKKSRRVFQRKETRLKLESWENYRKFASLRKHEVDREKNEAKKKHGIGFSEFVRDKIPNSTVKILGRKLLDINI